MFKTFILTIISIFVLSISLSSCEGETRAEVYIQNKTTGIIHIEGALNGDYYSDDVDITFSMDLEVNEKYLIYKSRGRGGSSYRMNPAHRIDTLKISDSDGNPINKSFTEELDWNYDYEEESKIPSTFFQEYILVVKDSESKK